MSWKIYHNPNCTKSRKSLEMLNEKGLELEVVHYIEVGLTEGDLEQITSCLGLRPKDFVRVKEEIFKEATVDLENDLQVSRLIMAHPVLLERPIVIFKDKAVIGRPPENLHQLF